jgi:transcriptional regulator with XRE-family HTH domain
MKKFGEYVKEKRTEANLTQDQLAELMKVSLNSVQGWESGKYKTKKARLADLAKHLGVDANELESVYNDDGEDFSNFPSFLYTDNQNEIIKTLRLTPEHKELVMLLKIYNSDKPDEGVGGWSSTVMSCLKRIPYKYVENKGAFKVYELGLHLSKFFRYVPVSFCFEMIRNNPNTVFDIRTLDKNEILKWMDLDKFGEQYYIDRAISFRNFQESTEKLNKWEYRNRKKQLSHNDLCTSQPQVPFTEVVFDDENYTITNKLTQAGILFKEWCRDLELDPKQHV